jgi:putative oxidoreductase
MRALVKSINQRELGFVLLRVVLGCFFIYYGSGKILKPEKWAWLGSQVPFIGFDPFNYVLGFIASVSEFVGGIFLVAGFFVRIASLLMMATMAVATYYHIVVAKWSSLPLLYCLLFLCVFLLAKEDK